MTPAKSVGTEEKLERLLNRLEGALDRTERKLRPGEAGHPTERLSSKTEPKEQG